MPLDPQVQEFLAEQTALNLPPVTALPPGEARARMEAEASLVDPDRMVSHVEGHRMAGRLLRAREALDRVCAVVRRKTGG